LKKKILWNWWVRNDNWYYIWLYDFVPNQFSASYILFLSSYLVLPTFQLHDFILFDKTALIEFLVMMRSGPLKQDFPHLACKTNIRCIKTSSLLFVDSLNYRWRKIYGKERNKKKKVSLCFTGLQLTAADKMKNSKKKKKRKIGACVFTQLMASRP
jgi:hypothetical protein